VRQPCEFPRFLLLEVENGRASQTPVTGGQDLHRRVVIGSLLKNSFAMPCLTSAAKASENKTLIAALKRCATQIR
jgi:hypothetical protein